MTEELGQSEAARRLQDRFQRMARLARELSRRPAQLRRAGGLSGRSEAAAHEAFQPSRDQPR